MLADTSIPHDRLDDLCDLLHARYLLLPEGIIELRLATASKRIIGRRLRAPPAASTSTVAISKWIRRNGIHTGRSLDKRIRAQRAPRFFLPILSEHHRGTNQDEPDEPPDRPD